MTTGISWADETWNPFVGCTPVSPACKNCYAQDMAARIVMMEAGRGRLSHYATAVRQTPKGPAWTGHIARAELAARFAPFKWARPRDIFVGSMTDFFHPAAPDDWRIEALAVMVVTPRHQYLLLTKRSADMRRFMSAPGTAHAVWKTAAKIAIERDLCLAKIEDMQVGAWPLPNVALGVTAEDQVRADERIPDLLATPAAKRFVSCEPLLGPLDLETAWHGESALDSECWGDCGWCKQGHPPLHNCARGRQSAAQWDKGRSGIDWVIAGGESGSDARPSHPDWLRRLRDQCAAAGVPFHFKQWGEWAPDAVCGDHLKFNARDPDEELHGWPYDEDADAWRIGTRRAGRLLDGVEHHARPFSRPNPAATNRD